MLPYGFRVLGGKDGERRLVSWQAAFAGYAACDQRAQCEREAYLSAFRYGQDFKAYLEAKGSVKGFAGDCGAEWLWWDIDRKGDLEAGKVDTAKLVTCLSDRFALSDDKLLVFFSGMKGFHIGMPLYWHVKPSRDFNGIAERFCQAMAADAGVVIDLAVYDKVRLFRAPNSRHPQTKLYKVPVTLEQLMHAPIASILKQAATPLEFGIPDATGCGDFNAPALWNELAGAVRQKREAQVRHAAAIASGTSEPRLNRATLAFIREGAEEGERARLL